MAEFNLGLGLEREEEVKTENRFFQKILGLVESKYSNLIKPLGRDLWTGIGNVQLWFTS